MPQMLVFLKSQIDVNTNVKADNGVPEMLRIPKSAEIPDEPEVVPEDVDEPSPSNKYRCPDLEPKNKVHCEPTKNDVLMGRGGQARHHSGNKAYLNDRDALQGEYSRAVKKGKGVISQKLVNKVRGRGGRFLKWDKLVNRWYEVFNCEARKKASQALREGCGAKMKQQNTKKRSTEDSEDAKPKAKKIKKDSTKNAPESSLVALNGPSSARKRLTEDSKDAKPEAKESNTDTTMQAVDPCSVALTQTNQETADTDAIGHELPGCGSLASEPDGSHASLGGVLVSLSPLDVDGCDSHVSSKEVNKMEPSCPPSDIFLSISRSRSLLGRISQSLIGRFSFGSPL
jgi:hypothetical protein